MLPLLRLPPFFDGQMGVPGSEVPLGIRAAGGNVYYLGTSVGEITAADVHSGLDPLRPKATLESALGECVSGRGDVIVVMPGIYTFAAPVTVDIDRVKILSFDYLLGLAVGQSVFVGTAADVLSVEADHVEAAGIVFDTDANALRTAVTALDVSGLRLHDNVFKSGLAAVVLGVAADTPADFVIENNFFAILEDTAANTGILLAAGAALGVIRKNIFYSGVTEAVRAISLPNASTPGVIIVDNEFQMQTAGHLGIYRAGADADASIHRNHFSGAGTPITVAADGGDHAVNNYAASAAGGAIVDPTT